MVPAVIWLGAVASLMAVWVEAVVGAPLWAFAHLDTEGDGVGQRAQSGYLFMMNVLFRPTLMVVGFLLGSIMVKLLTDFVMNIYPVVIANIDADSWTGLIKMVGFFTAFVIILQMIVNLSFQMIRFVPDQVLGWIGGNSQNQIGAQAADEVGSAAKNAFASRGVLSQASGLRGKLQNAESTESKDKKKQDAKDAAFENNQNLASALGSELSKHNGSAGGVTGGVAGGKGTPKST